MKASICRAAIRAIHHHDYPSSRIAWERYGAQRRRSYLASLGAS